MSPAADAARYRRVDPLFIECAERRWLDPLALFSGQIAVGPQPVLRAWAPPASAPVEISALEAWLLASLPAHALAALPDVAASAERDRAAARLCALGLLSTDRKSVV